MPKSIELYQPWEAFKILKPAIAAGRARVILLGFPGDEGDWWADADIRSSDHFYLKRMKPAIRIDSRAAVGRLLAERLPTLLICCRASALSSLIDSPEMRGRIDERFSSEQPGLIARGVDLDSLFHSSLHDSSPRPVLRKISSAGSTPSEDEDFERSFSVSVDPPLAVEAWVTADVTLDQPSPATRLMFNAMADGEGAGYFVMPWSAGAQRLTAHIEAKTFLKHTPVKVTFRILPMDGGKEMIRGVVQNITFNGYATP
jgi:hypothetical protein